MRLRPIRCFVLCLLGALLAACERAPDPATLHEDLQRALDDMHEDLLRVAALNAQGVGPAAAADEVIAYANVTLELLRDHDFGGWDGASIGTLASTLGATDRGVRGIRAGGNAAGDRLQVYASAIYARDGAGWRYLGGGAPAMDPAAAAQREPESVLEQVETILARSQDNALSPRARLIERELGAALAQIKQQIGRAPSGNVIAGGPLGGEYAKIAAGLAHAVHTRDVRLAVFHSEGSVQNATLVHAGDVALGIVQSDVLALAHAARGPFAAGEPLFELVALATLYPEPVHVIVPADSELTTLADLAGKRVALGAAGSGTRLTARQVLAAHGLSPEDLGAIDDDGLEEAAQRLAHSRIDAMFVTIGAPNGALRRLAAQRPIRLLALDETAIATMTRDHEGYVRHVIASSTYRGQHAAVPSIATTAVLIARRTLLDGLVEQVLDALFFEMDHQSTGSLQGGLVAPRTATRGLTIPLHPAAQQYYSRYARPAPQVID